MLVIIAVIGILAALLLPTLGRAKESARATACLSNLRQVGIALQLYVQDHENRLPVMYDALISTNGPSTNTATIDIVLSNYLVPQTSFVAAPTTKISSKKPRPVTRGIHFLTGRMPTISRSSASHSTRTTSPSCSTRSHFTRPAARCEA
jgi:type II secretory pathway pseudopilin PulG